MKAQWYQRNVNERTTVRGDKAMYTKELVKLGELAPAVPLFPLTDEGNRNKLCGLAGKDSGSLGGPLHILCRSDQICIVQRATSNIHRSRNDPCGLKRNQQGPL